jgi:hypothetical protein
MLKEEYINLLSINPKISDLITKVTLAELTKKLERGRNEVKSTQVHSIGMKEITNWGLGVPVDKHLRGFSNDVCGHLLCPSNRDWNNAACVNNHFSPFCSIVAGLTELHIALNNRFERLKSQ